MTMFPKTFWRVTPPLLRLYGVALLAILMSGCALTLPPRTVPPQVSPQWQAPLPHQGALVQLRQWWRAQGDPLLVELQDAAQEASPGVAQANARLQSARANQAAARAALVPRVDATLAASRGQTQPAMPAATSLSLGAQASWELDLVGANRVVKDAADAQVQAGQAQWHDARVAVAAEVASTYFGLRACRRQADIVARDAASRQETERLTALLLRAGMARSADLALSQASAAESRKRLTQQNADCDLALKALVSLTALDETRLRQRLDTGAVAALELPGFGVAQVPAQTVSQRPDVFSAERDVVVASAAVGSAQAQRWPRLTLSGSIGALRYASTGTETDMTTWSFGPLALSVPVFDAGQRAANVVAAQAQYAQSVVAYRAKVRAAVREVEEALVALQSVQARHGDTVLALRGYTEALEACTLRHQKGMASLLELEETRRMALGAELALDALQLERQRAWLALYRAAGGGWEPDSSAATPLAPGPSAAP
jgi:hypothetical protein